MTKKAVLWDMDGTLIDSEPLHISALASAMKELGISVPKDLVARVTGLDAEAVYAWLAADYGLNLSFDQWIAKKYSEYVRRVHEVKEIPQASELWQTLKHAGIAQAIVSNSDRIIVESNLGHLGLTAAKMVTVSRNDVRHGKPAPEPYLRASWLLNVEPTDCIVLEDSPTGARAGVAARMTTFLVPHAEFDAPSGASKLSTLADVSALCAL